MINVLCVVGPTASGKSNLGLKLAKDYNGEIISCDSMQVYKGMDILSAKPSAEDMSSVRHHMINVAERSSDYSVALYVKAAKEAVSDVSSRSKLPIIVGGTGLYFDSLINNIQFLDSSKSEETRNELNSRLEIEGGDSLYNELCKIDPQAAEKISPKNHVKVIRALEIYYVSGKTLTMQNELSANTPSDYNPCIIGLDAADRQFLYSRINKRADIMLEGGLIEEVRDLYNSGYKNTGSSAIGYKEFIPYIEGKESLSDAVSKFKMSTRRYAKRQLTWFHRNKNIYWLCIDEYDSFDSLVSAAEKIYDSYQEEGLK